MFAFANMVDFFPHIFAGLCGRRLAFALIFAGSFRSFLFRHLFYPECFDANGLPKVLRSNSRTLMCGVIYGNGN
jgi:hypothetical protein